MVVYYYQAGCHAQSLDHYLQCQSHSEGLNKQNMTISTISCKLLVHLHPNLAWKYCIKSWSVLWKNWITAFKVKVTAMIHNVSECLSG